MPGEVGALVREEDLGERQAAVAVAGRAGQNDAQLALALGELSGIEQRERVVDQALPALLPVLVPAAGPGEGEIGDRRHAGTVPDEPVGAGCPADVQPG